MYSTYSTTSSAASAGEILGAFFAAFIGLIIFAVAIAVVVLVAKYKLFKKMGIDGWKALIPMVSDYLQMEKTGVDQRWLLIVTFGSIVNIIPILGFLVLLAAMIYYAILVNVSLAKSFGKDTGFAVGLILLNPIFLCILAFSGAKYEGAKPMNDIIFKNNK